jgi:hypothetical protein
MKYLANVRQFHVRVRGHVHVRVLSVSVSVYMSVSVSMSVSSSMSVSVLFQFKYDEYLWPILQVYCQFPRVLRGGAETERASHMREDS